MKSKEFRQLAELGKGSYGQVYRVIHLPTNRQFAMKIIDMKEQTQPTRQKTIREVDIMKSLRSQFVVQYHDSFIEGNSLFIVMEYCSRKDLATIIKKTPGYFPQNTVWMYILQIMLGLREIHKAGVAHRDLNCKNILLDKDSNAKISDLGVAKEIGPQLTHTVCGTPYSMSPEMLTRKEYGVKTDIWSLGCLVYEICAKTPPFLDSTSQKLIKKIEEGKFDPIPITYSRLLEKLIRDCLAKEQLRPSIEEILNDPNIISKAEEVKVSLKPKTLNRRQNAGRGKLKSVAGTRNNSNSKSSLTALNQKIEKNHFKRDKSYSNISFHNRSQPNILVRVQTPRANQSKPLLSPKNTTQPPFLWRNLNSKAKDTHQGKNSEFLSLGERPEGQKPKTVSMNFFRRQDKWCDQEIKILEVMEQARETIIQTENLVESLKLRQKKSLEEEKESQRSSVEIVDIQNIEEYHFSRIAEEQNNQEDYTALLSISESLELNRKSLSEKVEEAEKNEDLSYQGKELISTASDLKMCLQNMQSIVSQRLALCINNSKIRKKVEKQIAIFNCD